MKHAMPLAGLLCLMLAGCSGAPSEGDVRDAVEAHFEMQMKAMVELLGNGEAVQKQIEEMKQGMSDTKLIGCKESEPAPGYLCDVEMEIPMIGRHVVPLRMIKSDGDWLIAGGLQ